MRRGAKDSREWLDAHVQAQCVWSARTRGGHTESPHAAATPMMARAWARARKWTTRCPAVGSLSRVLCPVLVVLVFCNLGLVSVWFCSFLTWNVPNWLRRAKTPWSCRKAEGRGEHVLLALRAEVAEGGETGYHGIVVVA